MSNQDEAILEFDIILNAKLSQDVSSQIDKLEKLEANQKERKEESTQKKAEREEQREENKKQADIKRKEKEEVKEEKARNRELKKQEREKQREERKKQADIKRKEREETKNRKAQERAEKKEEKDRLKAIKDDEAETQLAKLNPDVQAFFSNPKGFIADNVSQAIQQQFEDVLESISVIAIAILAVKVGEEVLKLMTQKGGPLNRDWRRFIELEVDVGLSRIQQKEKELGFMQTILTQVQGFKPNNENWTYNSLYDVNDSRVARVGLSDKEFGVTMMVR